ncbi:hypothetical protein H4J38_06960 [Colwellia sp. BRX10-3]|uniref:hypothetical protein n=1 Tax=Colwellia sp. BRX10-3 TaxID=2759844 RepID=UPI0015F512FA|nr:hypothetical protein [Colwellia sp. BRX10-3]MBA6390523.1 hypothetical protein [Colwellia sp. BRX10-3]
MKKYIFALSLVSLFNSAGEFETAVGLGHQYGSILGAQLGYKTESTKYYASLGYVGIATGFQTTFSENSKHAYGLVAGVEAWESDHGFIFATYDYHFNGFSNPGFVIGTGFGFTRGESLGDTFVDFSSYGESEPKKQEDIKAEFTLNIGYKF